MYVHWPVFAYPLPMITSQAKFRKSNYIKVSSSSKMLERTSIKNYITRGEDLLKIKITSIKN